MKKKLLIAALAAALAAPSAFAATPTYGAATDGTDADDKQTVIIKVPEVALLNIGDTGVPVTALTAPTTAGGGFIKYDAATAATSSFKLSSNIANTTSPVKRKVTVAVDTTATAAPNNKTIPEGATLSISTSSATVAGIGTTALLTKTSTTVPVTADLGNVAVDDGQITYQFGATDANGMIAYTGDGTTTDTITLIYTLTDDTV